MSFQDLLSCLSYLVSLLKEPLILLRAEARVPLKDLPEGADVFLSDVTGHLFKGRMRPFQQGLGSLCRKIHARLERIEVHFPDIP